MADVALLVLVSRLYHSSSHCSYDGQLSLGFGRPQSTQLETVDEHGFLQLRLRQQIPRPGSGGLGSNLHGDVYIAGMVQLTQVSSDPCTKLTLRLGET